MELWYLLPAAILIAAIANGAGIGGATFFSPLFVIVLALEPRVAIGTALITEVFGFASGVYAHARARRVDWKVAGRLVAAAVPAAVVGSLVAGAIDETVLKLILALGLAAIAVAFIRHHDHAEEDAAIAAGEGVEAPFEVRQIVTTDGTVYDYRLCRRREGQWFAALGGLFVGMISTGLGEVNSYALVKRCRVPTQVTVATSVVTVAVTALAAGVTHAADFIATGAEAMDTVLSIVVFTVPGVIVGGQLGPRLLARVPGDRLIRGLGWLFAVVATITAVEAMA